MALAPMDSRSTRRHWLALAGAAAAAAAAPLRAQDLSPLRPNEAIEVPGGTVTVLGLELKRGDKTGVKLRLRVQAAPKGSVVVSDKVFRLVAAGVPRAPERSFSFLVAPDSAEDFEVGFNIPDRTDDLVLQLRVDDTVVRRRLQAR